MQLLDLFTVLVARAAALCRNPVRRSALMLLAAGAILGAEAQPAEARAARQGVIVVIDDRGGIVGERADEIAAIREAGQRVEIRGSVCLSSCTMYLSLPDTCVSPDTDFGFHGPSWYGAPLAPQDFEYWSRVIASHYPETLAEWYMTTGRTRITSYFTIKGRNLIRLGIKPCDARAL